MKGFPINICKQIFIINISGFCVAIGGCDIRIASNKAKMGLNFVKIGLHPGSENYVRQW